MSSHRKPSRPGRNTAPQSLPSISETPSAPPRALRPGDLAEPVPLEDFFTGVAELFQLPPKRPTVPGGVPAVPAGAKARTVPGGSVAVVPRTWRRSQLVLPLVAIVCVALAAVSALRVPDGAAVPAPLVGVWTTTHPDFAGRTLAFSDSAIELGVAPGVPRQRFPIWKVRTRQDVQGMHLVVAYGDPDDPMSLQMTLMNGQTRQIEFARPEGLVWTPVTPPRR